MKIKAVYGGLGETWIVREKNIDHDKKLFHGIVSSTQLFKNYSLIGIIEATLMQREQLERLFNPTCHDFSPIFTTDRIKDFTLQHYLALGQTLRKFNYRYNKKRDEFYTK